MQFTLHATRRTPQGASRLVQAMLAWLVKTRRAPYLHGRDARVYGYTTTAMHKLSTPYPLQAVLGILRMQLTLHATRRTARGVSRVVQAMSPRSMKH